MLIEDFEDLVAMAIAELPEHIQKKLDNVAIVVEESPTPSQLKSGGTRKDSILLGLYEGVPRSMRGANYTLVLPDKISIFKKSIESIAVSNDEIKDQIKKTVWHEIAHHFGFSELGVRELEKKRKRRQG